MDEPTKFTEVPTLESSHVSLEFDLRQALRHAACGLLMGGADVIPGVSGGTVALVLGIYERLVTAISRCDVQLWKHLKHRQWSAAFFHLDLPFLLALGFGIALGAVSLGGLMNELLSQPASRTYALAALFGLIAASAAFVGRLVWRNETTHPAVLGAAAVFGAVFAAGLTQLTTDFSSTSLLYVFAVGAVAICAMILPGISGAYLLLILGLYDHVTGILKALPRGQVTPADLVTLGVFACGCGLGLISFSKLLKWLLRHYHGVTMAVLCGFMIGAMSKVWPFQKDLTPDVEKLSHKRFENFLPALDAQLLLCLLIATACFAAVFLLDYLAVRRKLRTLST